jgi:hypothetical protein
MLFTCKVDEMETAKRHIFHSHNERALCSKNDSTDCVLHIRSAVNRSSYQSSQHLNAENRAYYSNFHSNVNIRCL